MASTAFPVTKTKRRMKSVKRPKQPPTLVLRGCPLSQTRRSPGPLSAQRPPRPAREAGDRMPHLPPGLLEPPPPPTSADPIRFLPSAALLLLFPPQPGPGPPLGAAGPKERVRGSPPAAPPRLGRAVLARGPPHSNQVTPRPGLPALETAQDLLSGAPGSSAGPFAGWRIGRNPSLAQRRGVLKLRIYPPLKRWHSSYF